MKMASHSEHIHQPPPTTCFGKEDEKVWWSWLPLSLHHFLPFSLLPNKGRKCCNWIEWSYFDAIAWGIVGVCTFSIFPMDINLFAMQDQFVTLIDWRWLQIKFNLWLSIYKAIIVMLVATEMWPQFLLAGLHGIHLVLDDMHYIHCTLYKYL